ncbi:hypothetical protein [Streptomyces sennicomposti]
MHEMIKGSNVSLGTLSENFIRSVDDAVHRFRTTVVLHLDRPGPRRPKEGTPAA